MWSFPHFLKSTDPAASGKPDCGSLANLAQMCRSGTLRQKCTSTKAKRLFTADSRTRPGKGDLLVRDTESLRCSGASYLHEAREVHRADHVVQHLSPFLLINFLGLQPLLQDVDHLSALSTTTEAEDEALLASQPSLSYVEQLPIRLRLSLKRAAKEEGLL